MSPRGRLVLETLAVANGFLVTVVGVITLLFFDGVSGLVLTVASWVAAVVLFGIAGRLRSGAEFE